MQSALASRDDIEDFRPEPATAESVKRLVDDALRRTDQLCERLLQARDRMADADRAAADGILAIKPKLITCFEELLKIPADWVDIRHHGDFHLAQMLVVKDDIFIINLEGEPTSRPRRTPPQGAGGPRRRRRAAVDRLFGGRRPAARNEGFRRRSGKACRGARTAGATSRSRRFSPPTTRPCRRRGFGPRHRRRPSACCASSSSSGRPI